MKTRTVLVTGGAKRLGAAIVRRLSADGHRVVIHHGRSSDEAAALAAEVGALGCVAGDLFDLSDAAALIGRARRVAGGVVDGLVNSASAFEQDGPDAIDPVLYTRLGAINGGAPALLASALAGQEGLEDGAVVNILDQKVANLNPDFFSYSCGKIALEGATVMLAQGLPKVAVNAVSPGLTLPSGGQTDAEFAAVARENLLRRPVGAENVAAAVSYLIGSRGVTGQNLFVDAGQRFLKRDRDVMFGAAHG